MITFLDAKILGRSDRLMHVWPQPVLIPREGHNALAWAVPRLPCSLGMVGQALAPHCTVLGLEFAAIWLLPG